MKQVILQQLQICNWKGKFVAWIFVEWEYMFPFLAKNKKQNTAKSFYNKQVAIERCFLISK